MQSSTAFILDDSMFAEEDLVASNDDETPLSLGQQQQPQHANLSPNSTSTMTMTTTTTTTLTTSNDEENASTMMEFMYEEEGLEKLDMPDAVQGASPDIATPMNTSIHDVTSDMSGATLDTSGLDDDQKHAESFTDESGGLEEGSEGYTGMITYQGFPESPSVDNTATADEASEHQAAQALGAEESVLISSLEHQQATIRTSTHSTALSPTQAVAITVPLPSSPLASADDTVKTLAIPTVSPGLQTNSSSVPLMTNENTKPNTPVKGVELEQPASPADDSLSKKRSCPPTPHSRPTGLEITPLSAPPSTGIPVLGYPHTSPGTVGRVQALQDLPFHGTVVTSPLAAERHCSSSLELQAALSQENDSASTPVENKTTAGSPTRSIIRTCEKADIDISQPSMPDRQTTETSIAEGQSTSDGVHTAIRQEAEESPANPTPVGTSTPDAPPSVTAKSANITPPRYQSLTDSAHPLDTPEPSGEKSSDNQAPIAKPKLMRKTLIKAQKQSANGLERDSSSATMEPVRSDREDSAILVCPGVPNPTPNSANLGDLVQSDPPARALRKRPAPDDGNAPSSTRVKKTSRLPRKGLTRATSLQSESSVDILQIAASCTAAVLSSTPAVKQVSSSEHPSTSGEKDGTSTPAPPPKRQSKRIAAVSALPKAKSSIPSLKTSASTRPATSTQCRAQATVSSSSMEAVVTDDDSGAHDSTSRAGAVDPRLRSIPQEEGEEQPDVASSSRPTAPFGATRRMTRARPVRGQHYAASMPASPTRHVMASPAKRPEMTNHDNPASTVAAAQERSTRTRQKPANSRTITNMAVPRSPTRVVLASPARASTVQLPRSPARAPSNVNWPIAPAPARQHVIGPYSPEAVRKVG